MENASDDSMRQALKQRKARGLDITILLGHDGAKGDDEQEPEPHAMEDVKVMNHDEDEEERKALGLAPDATPIGVHDGNALDSGDGDIHENQPGNEETKKMVDHALMSSPMGKGHLFKKMSKHMMKHKE